MSNILFFNDDVNYRLLHKKILRRWLNDVAQKEGYKISTINIILCSDNQILKTNIEHLNHDFYTDIITFDYSVDKTLEGELYISIERVKSNAESLGIKISSELHRVFVHGILHMCGYGDKTSQEKSQMRSKENHYLESLSVN